MRKYRLTKVTNLNTGEVAYEIQKRKYLFFWENVEETYSGSLEISYKRYLKLLYPQPKVKFKREEVAIDNVYL